MGRSLQIHGTRKFFPSHFAYLGVQVLGFCLCKALRNNFIVKGTLKIMRTYTDTLKIKPK